MVLSIAGALIIFFILKSKINQRQDFDPNLFGILIGLFTALLWGLIVMALVESDIKKLAASQNPADAAYGQRMQAQIPRMTKAFWLTLLAVILFLAFCIVAEAALF